VRLVLGGWSWDLNKKKQFENWRTKVQLHTQLGSSSNTLRRVDRWQNSACKVLVVSTKSSLKAAKSGYSCGIKMVSHPAPNATNGTSRYTFGKDQTD
jgi:hypothetical protein